MLKYGICSPTVACEELREGKIASKLVLVRCMCMSTADSISFKVKYDVLVLRLIICDTRNILFAVKGEFICSEKVFSCYDKAVFFNCILRFFLLGRGMNVCLESDS